MTAPAKRPALGWLVGLGLVAGSFALGAALQSRQAEREPPLEVRPTPSVVTAVRALSRLESVSFHMERVFDVRSKQSHFFGLFDSEDALLLVAAADVVAGVDLSLLREDDVVAAPAEGRVRVVLPPPQILAAHLDGARTYVYARTTDALARPSHTLESRARQEAEQTLREAALEAGILERARAESERAVRTLLLGLGFRQIDVTTQRE